MTAATMPGRSGPWTIRHAWSRSASVWTVMVVPLRVSACGEARAPTRTSRAARRTCRSAARLSRRRDPAASSCDEVGDELVGAGRAHEVGQREAVLLHDHRVGADAEAAREAEQPLDAGRARACRCGSACRSRARAPPLIQSMTGSVSKANWVDDGIQPLLLQRGRLVLEVPPQHVVVDVGVALRVAAIDTSRTPYSAAGRCGSPTASPRRVPRARPGRRRRRRRARWRRPPGGGRGTPRAGPGTPAGGPRCAGRGRSPMSFTAFAAATRISRSSLPRNVTLICAAGIACAPPRGRARPCRSSRASSRRRALKPWGARWTDCHSSWATRRRGRWCGRSRSTAPGPRSLGPRSAGAARRGACACWGSHPRPR